MGHALRRIALVYDHGGDAGMGHQRRMESVATALRRRGATPTVIAQGPPVDADLIVVDSYRTRADDVHHFRAPFIAAIDDLVRGLAVDLVIDPSPGATAAQHPSARLVMAGADFAIVDPDLGCLATNDPGRDVRQVLVATGAADGGGRGLAMARDLRPLLAPEVRLALVVGPAAALPPIDGVDLVRTVDGLGPELARADIVLTAGGVTLLESLRLGRPTVAVILYDNQRRQTEGVVTAGAAILAPTNDAPQAVARLARHPRQRIGLSQRASALITGSGADRVAEAILAHV